MKTSGYVLDARPFRSISTPPAVLEDRSRSKITGTLANNAAYQRIASGLWVVGLDGTHDYVSLDAAASMPVDLTAIIWFKATDIAERNLFGRRGGTTNSYFEILNSTALYTDSETGVGRTFAVPAMVAGRFYQAVWTRLAGSSRVYLNGIESSTGALAQTGSVIFDQIGRYANSTNYIWKGQLSMPRLLVNALPADEIYSIFQRERGYFN